MDAWGQSWVPARRPVLLLFLLYVCWKAILFAVILCSPGPGYDTSTTLLDLTDSKPNHQTGLLSSSPTLSPSLLKLVRWDAIYFSQLSHRGHVFEQEWAFGVGLSGTVSFISTLISRSAGTGSALVEISVAVVLSHFTHFLTVLLLYALSQLISRRYRDSSMATSTIAAALHIISPAGAFLSAPYSESLFSTLNFLGLYLYLDGHITGGGLGDFKTVAAGVSFACATLVRSNGILGGLPFLYDAVLQSLHLLRDGISAKRVRRLLALGVGGVLIALGALSPQYKAYRKFCDGAVEQDRRPWCDSWFPSIFGWVQWHYWDVGLFRYWTAPNLPLFLLAMPCLWMLLVSSAWACTYPTSSISAAPKNSITVANLDKGSLIRLAMPQVVLALAAFTSYHVQIINRLSSGYPLWYIWLASAIVVPAKQPHDNLIRRGGTAQLIVRSIAIYAIVQGGLFASFLPPA